MSARQDKWVPGTNARPVDSIEPVSRENSMSAPSVPGTEGYIVDNKAAGAAE